MSLSKKYITTVVCIIIALIGFIIVMAWWLRSRAEQDHISIASLEQGTELSFSIKKKLTLGIGPPPVLHLGITLPHNLSSKLADDGLSFAIPLFNNRVFVHINPRIYGVHIRSQDGSMEFDDIQAVIVHQETFDVWAGIRPTYQAAAKDVNSLLTEAEKIVKDKFPNLFG